MRITHSQLVSSFASFTHATIENKFNYISLYLTYYESTSHFTNPFLTNPTIDSSCLDFLLSKARDSYQIYTETPSSVAHAYLGIVYETGCFNITKDIDRALTFYLAASKQNNALGAFRLAQVFERLKNMDKALVYYRLASKLGSIEACHTYGIILMHGYGVDKDVATGLIYLKRAVSGATVKYPFALFDLAKTYEESDPDYAFELYLRGSELEDPNCQFMVAKIYENGDFFQEVNFEKSLNYYEMAANQGQIDAMFTLSTKTNNMIQAYEMALGAASRGHPGAAEMTGDLISRGLGVVKNPVYALWWYLIARELGNSNCEDKILGLKPYAAGNENVNFGKKRCIYL